MSKQAPLYEVELQGEVRHFPNLVEVNHFLNNVALKHQGEIDGLIDSVNTYEPLAEDEAEELFEQLENLQNEDPLLSLIIRRWNADRGTWEEEPIDAR